MEADQAYTVPIPPVVVERKIGYDHSLSLSTGGVTVMIWVLAIPLAFLIVLGLFTLSALVQPEAAGRRMLKKRLRTLGIQPSQFSDSCLTELVECGTDHHKYMRQTKALHLKRDIEDIAIIIAQICFGEEGHTAAKIKEHVEYLLLDQNRCHHNVHGDAWRLSLFQ